MACKHSHVPQGSSPRAQIDAVALDYGGDFIDRIIVDALPNFIGARPTQTTIAHSDTGKFPLAHEPAHPAEMKRLHGLKIA